MSCYRSTGSAALILALLTGCATAKIESNLRPGFNKKINSVYANIAASSGSSATFAKELKVLLETRLRQRGVRCNVHIHDDLGLNEKALVQEEMKAFKPDFLFFMAQDSTTTVNGVDQGAGFKLTLFEVGSENPFWKANLSTGYAGTVSGTTGTPMSASIGSPEKTCDSILECLAKDGLINPAPGAAK